ncbi:MAG: hypothetical protein S4CHLAM20_05270 [Chlamydiia bacterium]|nr:hypothetical protein [Chlamydiia bacterium]
MASAIGDSFANLAQRGKCLLVGVPLFGFSIYAFKAVVHNLYEKSVLDLSTRNIDHLKSILCPETELNQDQTLCSKILGDDSEGQFYDTVKQYLELEGNEIQDKCNNNPQKTTEELFLNHQNTLAAIYQTVKDSNTDFANWVFVEQRKYRLSGCSSK